MSVNKTPATLSPYIFTPGAPVYADAIAVIEHLNWTAGERPETYFSVFGGPDSAFTNGVDCARLLFNGTVTTWYSHILTNIRINLDVPSMTFRFRPIIQTGITVSIRLTIGSEVQTVSLDDTDSGVLQTIQVFPGDTGTGWQAVTLELRRDGGGSTAYIRSASLQADAIAVGDLQQPEND